MPYELSTEWAETYFGNRLYTSRWDSASATDKEKSLKQASSLLEAVYRITQIESNHVGNEIVSYKISGNR